MSDAEDNLQSIHLSSFLGWDGAQRPGEDDPAEAYHEAAKLSGGSPMAPGAQLKQSDPVALEVFTRSTKRYAHLPSVELPPADYPSTGIAEAMAGRRSRRSFGESPISLVQLSTLLHAAYGVTDASDTNGGQPFRNVPSGGGLYPLDVYPVVRNVEEVPAGLYHYEPLRGVLELIRDQDIDEALREILLVAPGMPDFTNSCGLVFFVVGTFWRTRFKYALRGYRFTLIEAGHLGQNLLLTAESLGINAFANGGYWDHRVDSFLGVDGVNESVIYSVVAGSAPTESGP